MTSCSRRPLAASPKAAWLVRWKVLTMRPLLGGRWRWVSATRNPTIRIPIASHFLKTCRLNAQQGLLRCRICNMNQPLPLIPLTASKSMAFTAFATLTCYYHGRLMPSFIFSSVLVMFVALRQCNALCLLVAMRQGPLPDAIARILVCCCG